jgi:polar amino acid transport system substrate-binding protein
MKRLIILSLLLLAAMPCLAQTEKTVTVVLFEHAPFAYMDAKSNTAKGAEVAYLTAILKDMGYQPAFTFVPFARMTKMLQEGETDIGPFLTKTPEREAFAYFSSKTVLTLNPVLVVRKDNPLKQLKAPSDVKGMKIGFTSNLAMPAFFKDNKFATYELITGKYENEQNFKKLIAKRFDAFIEMNPINAKLAAKTLGVTDSVRILDVPGAGSVYYCSISKKSKIASSLLKGINASMNTNKFNLDKYLQEEMK